MLGFAFREIGENLLAGLLLGLSRSFEVGDLVECHGFRGEVRDIEVRHLHLRTPDGRDVTEPLGEAIRLSLEATEGVEGVLAAPEAAVLIDSFEAGMTVSAGVSNGVTVAPLEVQMVEGEGGGGGPPVNQSTLRQ